MTHHAGPPHLYAGSIVLPDPASTVIPIRESEDGGIEVYMTQRSLKLRFLGGYYVFPGGKVDAQDSDPEAISRCRGVTPGESKRLLNSDLGPEKCLAYWVAGIRELFEEAGILLALNRRNEFPDFNVRRVRKGFDKYRKLIQDGEIKMNHMMKKAQLRYAAGQLIYFSHWITPPGPPKRFDTRFFIALVPPSQRPRYHIEEVREGIWLKPQEALDKASRGEWKMIPPTIISLQTIARHETPDDLLRELSR